MRFSLKTLLIVKFVLALVIAVCVYFANKWDRERRPTDPARWPLPIQEIVKTSPDMKRSIKVYDLQGFMDHTNLLAISDRSELIDKIVSDFKLVKTNKNHRFANKLLGSMPNDWKRPSPSCVWYTTPGFGTVHQEGVDLFLIAVDPEGGDAVILYDWIF